MRKNFKTWGLSLYLAYALTLLLVFVTVFAILLRVGISRLETNPEWIESWLSSQLNADVKFKNLEIASLGNTISLSLKDLNVRVKHTNVSLVRAAEIEVKIDWLKSALNFGLETSSLKLKSPFVSLIHHQDGRFSIGNLESFKKNDRNSRFDNWLFKQKRINMSNLDLNFHSVRFNKSWQIKQANLVVVPSGSAQKMEIHSSFANQGWLRIRAQWSGKLNQSNGWQGRALVNGQNLPADLILSFAPNEFIRLHQSLVSINSQFKWQNGKLQFGSGQLDMSQTLLLNPKSRSVLFIKHFSAGFQAQSVGEFTQTNFNLKLPSSESVPEQKINLYTIFSADKIEIASPSLSPDLLEYFAPILYSGEVKKTLGALNPKGSINHVQISIPRAANQSLKAKLNFSNVAFNPASKIPGISPTSGSLYLDGKNIRLDFDSDDFAVHFPTDIFRKPLKTGKTTGTFTLSLLENQQWVLSSEKIISKTATANLGVAFNLQSVPDKKKPFIELLGNFNAATPAMVPDYLPIKIMKPKAIEWLDKAFSTGTVTNGLIQLHGNLNQYPFVDKTAGSQRISMDVSQGELFYQTGWPKIKDLSAQVTFNERGMICQIHQAKSAGLSLKSAHATIANFNGLPLPKLVLEISTQSDLPALSKFLRQTPLEKTFSKTLSALSMQGPAKLKLAIEIPLKKLKAQLKTLPKVKGTLSLGDNQLKILPLNLNLFRLTGEISFTEKSVASSNIKGSSLGGNFSGKIATLGAFNSPEGRIKIDANGTFAGHKIKAWTKFLTPDISGHVNWQTQLQFAKNGSHRAKISSNLQGATIFMPNIINKPKAKTLPSLINISWSPSQALINFSAGKIAKGVLQKNKTHAWRGGINLSPGKVKTSKTGILISGNLPFINLSSWDKWLNNQAKNTKSTKPLKQKILLAGTVNKLLLGQTNFNKVRVNGQYSQGKWVANFKTLAFSGKLNLPPKPAPMSISLDKYILNTNSSTRKTANSEMPKTKILLEIKSLILNNKSLGRFKANLTPTPSGANVSNLSLNSPAFNLSGSGTWYKKTNTSKFNIKMSAKRLQALLSSFGYTGKIKNGATNTSLITYWQGSPLSFSLKKINGSGKLGIGSGNFLDTNASGKSLLYLLKLNLSGIGKKGLDFRNIIGNYSLKNGVVTSQNLKLNSVAANIEFKGDTSLVKQTYNMRVTITPKLGGTLPLIGAATAGVPGLIIGGVAAVIDKISGHGISKAARKKLKVTGRWANPVVKPLGKTKQNLDNTVDTDLLGNPTQ